MRMYQVQQHFQLLTSGVLLCREHDDQMAAETLISLVNMPAAAPARVTSPTPKSRTGKSCEPRKQRKVAAGPVRQQQQLSPARQHKQAKQ